VPGSYFVEWGVEICYSFTAQIGDKSQDRLEQGGAAQPLASRRLQVRFIAFLSAFPLAP
jgi:hypothetical protein